MSNTMRFVTDLSKGILGESDSTDLWTEIIRHVDDSKLLDPNSLILILSCGHGTEADVLSKRMLALGVSKEDIQNRLYLLDKYHVFTNRALRRGYKNVVTTDYLEWNTNMKFNVILGNPPYQDPTGQNTIYPKFYAKAVDMLAPGGTLAMITPPAIIPGLWGVKQPDGIKMPAPIKIDYIKVGQCVKQHFPGVASEFCYFVLTNTSDTNQTVNVVTDAGQVVASGPIFPREATDIVLAQSILNKCFKFYNDPYSATSGDHGKSAKFDPAGIHVAVESISTTGDVKTRPITWIKKHKHFGKPKVIMPMYGKTAFIDYSHELVSAAQEKTSNGNLTGHNITTVLTNSDAESESLVSILESRLQVFFNHATAETRAPYINFLKNFIGVPLNQTYTNDSLETVLNLSKEEKEWLDANF
jgi:hypothetical protein